ncbi:GGDEF domain-containing protein [Sphingomonas sp. QA11]|uniref:GGDEF domain-containing protein n=1 Tax=Sphingomonas sp. QA11 TaxID=2950605 RepID=UPI00234931DF|nr:GGDEF domain-containing protein [Sphingomonas sp. QA11]WCM26411.1 GGDEF domain-containing protein [Sphingomonas sp. QA11]
MAEDTMADVNNALLFERIGAFLAEHRLSPDPRHYAFAYRICTEQAGPLAQAVASLTEGGFRLSGRDIESLGGEIGMLAVSAGAQDSGEKAAKTAEGLVAQTQMQVDGFTDMMHAIRAETQDFGRDLAASADAIRQSRDTLGIDEVVRLTGAMLGRVRNAETKLEEATHEASELRAKLEEARDNARRDPLTDLPNRRAFEEAYAAQATEGARLCVAVCDVDHFKLVNDRFGHAVGDRVLKAIGEALVKACEGHMVARYGGEEFAVLFSGVGLQVARATLEEARSAVAAKRYRLRESDEPLGAVTFSGGLTEASNEEGLDTAFGRADRLLYAAKHAGRNQLKTAHP